ncbi:DUF3168 domain-containing protein [Rhizobium sp. BK251]|uniref:DUF3168 domain-containing protein n=1 Tax=Rhizobium sp. BK251 TaxID=2512125 RepID=UPI001050608A|nr:DUF3168 domain-containing protein [Rhizobium sp. BK251]TCL76170.1 uncharacterized protein DUF3168 [Rhizobium sp. BK251]
MSAANELLKAIHALLAGDAALSALVGPDGVRDRLVSDRRMPCVVIGEVASNDYSTASEAGEEHFLTLEAWSDGGGRREAQEIAVMVRTLLDDAALELEGYALVSLQHCSTRTRREPKTKLFVAEMRFRAVTE